MATHQVNNTLYAGGSFTTVEGDLHVHLAEKFIMEALERLDKHVASGAFHNSAERYDAPKCYPRTRLSILQEIRDWVTDDNDDHPFLWMYGPAGSGKSSIAQSIAEILESNGKLAASFFFSRTAAGRNTGIHLVATIAHQLNVIIPELGEPIAEAIRRDRSIFSRSLHMQFDALVVRPLMQLSANGSMGNLTHSARRDWLIIIDGLDECGNGRSQRQILDVLFTAIQQYPLPLSFLIASRPEHEIRAFFNQESVASSARRLVLDDRYKPEEDIRLFLRSKFDDIKRSHPSGTHLPSTWPSHAKIEQLVRKASGQFVYVSTVIKFIESPRHWPTERLGIILGLISPGNNTPFADLDALYTHILEIAAADAVDRIKDIFSFLLFSKGFPANNFDMGIIEDLLQFRRGELQTILIDLHSLINVPAAPQFSQQLRLFHASLEDFLVDRSRSGTFFIGEGIGHARLTRYCIKQLIHNRGTSPFWFSYCSYKFMEHCLVSSQTRELYEDLNLFDFEEYLSVVTSGIQGGTLVLQEKKFRDFLPSLFKWLWAQSSQTRMPDLSLKYREHFDNYLRRHLAQTQYFQSPASLHLFSALTLKSYMRHSAHIFTLLTGDSSFLYDLKERQIPFTFVHLESEQESTYYKMVTEFLTDPSRCGIYHVDRTAYIKLAQIFTDAICTLHSTQSRHSSNTRSAQSVGNLERYLDCLLDILTLIPGERELASYLPDMPILQHLKYSRIAWTNEEALVAIRTYIEVTAELACPWSVQEDANHV